MSGYLTRERAVAQLMADGFTRAAANSILDGALRLYPQSARTTFLMVTGYKAGTRFGGVPSPIDLFMIGRW